MIRVTRMSLPDRQRLLQACSRECYTTEVPILHGVHTNRFCENLTRQHIGIRHPLRMLRRNDLHLLLLPSYIVTNSEVDSLCQILASDANDDVVGQFYDLYLAQLLDAAYARRKMWDKQLRCRRLDIGEKVSGLLRIGNALYRLEAISVMTREDRSPWSELAEPTSRDWGTIFVVDGRSLAP
jgi:hypothetical protein